MSEKNKNTDRSKRALSLSEIVNGWRTKRKLSFQLAFCHETRESEVRSTVQPETPFHPEDLPPLLSLDSPSPVKTVCWDIAKRENWEDKKCQVIAANSR